MSKAGSSLAAFLLSVPVSAILLMAVFGVPRFAPGVGGQAGGGGWQDPRQFIADITGASGGGEDELFHNYDPRRGAGNADDPFLSRRGGDEAPEWGAPARSDDRGSDENASTQRESDPGRVNGSDWPFRSRTNEADGRIAFNESSSRAAPQEAPRPAGDRFGTPAETSARLTWTQARRRLAELGIQQFHLEPGEGPDSFLFVCMFAPGDDPRVTRRFEAEAADPLAAVEDVLQQVDAWLEGRFSERTERVVQPFGTNW
jgi:hypothetical protein